MAAVQVFDGKNLGKEWIQDWVRRAAMKPWGWWETLRNSASKSLRPENNITTEVQVSAWKTCQLLWSTGILLVIVFFDFVG